jgi:2-polyprenyl-3-methyl-5-hydroxy-6-metoxy-1,4-benzoquinol methylase
MYAAALRDGTLLTRDWKQFDGARYTVVKGEHLSREELEGLLADAHWRWSLHVAARHVRASHPGEELASVVIDSPHELSRCAPGSLDLLQLAVPVDGLFAAGRRADSLLTHAERPAAEYGNEHMVGVLTDCYARLKPGGALVLGQGRPEDLPPAWEDRFLCEWATSHGLEVLGEINGFNGERMQALKRTREYDGYDELAAFAGESRSRVYRKCQHGNWWVASAWNAASPRTPAEREDFYRTSDAYLYELTHWEVNNNVPRFDLSQQCRGDVLEFGCGIGTLAMFVALNGMRVDTFDLSEPETAYLRWRAAQRPFCADRLRVLAGVDELGTYDTIVCLHVLEHVEEPEQVLRMLYGHLRPGGQMLLVAPFKEELSEMHPLHLHEHADLTLDTLLTDVGAELRGWRKYDGVYDLCIGGKPALTPPVPLA